jgi:hypothetical protein
MPADDVFGDILEAYSDQVLPARGPMRARLWLARQLLSWLAWKARRSMSRTGVPVRKFFGAIRVSLAWQPLWWMVWGPFLAVLRILRPGDFDPGEGLAAILIVGLIGLVSGTTFAVLLAASESGRAIAEVSLGRAALWGIAGAAIVPLVAGKYDQVFPFCPVGMAIGMALISVARKGALLTTMNPSGLRDTFLAWVFQALQEATNPPSARVSI